MQFEDEWCSLDKAIREIRHGGDNVKEGVFGCISPIDVCNPLNLVDYSLFGRGPAK